MLELGQWVRINARPTYGADEFDDDCIDTRDWISGIYIRDGHHVYELRDTCEECLWVENELTVLNDVADLSESSLWLGDEVYIGDNILDIQLITGVTVDWDDDYLYEFGGGLWYRDWELKLCRKKDEAHPGYTLF